MDHVAEEHHMAARVFDPQPLVYNKKPTTQFETLGELLRPLRSYGHRGICTEHYRWDRCGLEEMEALHRALHNLMAAAWADDDACFSAEEARQLEWFLAVACCLHDCSSALGWGMREELENADLMSNAWVGVESLRRSLDLIHRNLGYWVAIHLDYVAPVDLQQEDDPRSLYDALGAPPSLATYLASDLQIRWDEERRRMVVSIVHKRNPPIS